MMHFTYFQDHHKHHEDHNDVKETKNRKLDLLVDGKESYVFEVKQHWPSKVVSLP